MFKIVNSRKHFSILRGPEDTRPHPFDVFGEVIVGESKGLTNILLLIDRQNGAFGQKSYQLLNCCGARVGPITNTNKVLVVGPDEEDGNDGYKQAEHFGITIWNEPPSADFKLLDHEEVVDVDIEGHHLYIRRCTDTKKYYANLPAAHGRLEVMLDRDVQCNYDQNSPTLRLMYFESFNEGLDIDTYVKKYKHHFRFAHVFSIMPVGGYVLCILAQHQIRSFDRLVTRYNMTTKEVVYRSKTMYNLNYPPQLDGKPRLQIVVIKCTQELQDNCINFLNRIEE